MTEKQISLSDAISALLCASVSVVVASSVSHPAFAQFDDGDSVEEEQVKEKRELQKMRSEMDDINSTINGAMGELNELSNKMANQANAKEFHLFAREADCETYHGSTVHCLTYNGKIPGPPIQVKEGDFVKIVLHNQLKTPTSLTFHGLLVPHSVGGIPRAGAGLVAPGQTFVYQFVAKQPGTFWYHPHLIHPNQRQLGMYGAIAVEPKLRSRPYDKDITLMFSELRKTASVTAEGALGATRKVTALKVGQGKTAVSDRSATEETKKPGFTALAWTDGATPPDVETDYLINGRPAPNIPAIELRKGDRVHLRLINAGQEAVPISLSGHKMEVVAINGGDRLEPHVSRDTLTLNPSDRVDVEFLADNPGVWALASESSHQASGRGKFPGGMACLVRYSELKAQPDKPKE